MNFCSLNNLIVSYLDFYVFSFLREMYSFFPHFVRYPSLPSEFRIVSPTTFRIFTSYNIGPGWLRRWFHDVTPWKLDTVQRELLTSHPNWMLGWHIQIFTRPNSFSKKNQNVYWNDQWNWNLKSFYIQYITNKHVYDDIHNNILLKLFISNLKYSHGNIKLENNISTVIFSYSAKY